MDCQKADKDTFLDAAKTCEVALTPDDIESCKRLGRYEENKTRGIRIELKSEEKKRALFKNLHLLHRSQLATLGAMNKNSFVTIRHDFTIDQKEERKELLAEVANKNSELPLNTTMKFVVRGPPWQQRIQKIKIQQAQTPRLSA